MNGTNLKFLVAENANNMEGLIEALPFKVEIKSIYVSGGKVFCWFTLFDNQTLTSRPEIEMVSKKKTKTKKKNT